MIEVTRMCRKLLMGGQEVSDLKESTLTMN